MFEAAELGRTISRKDYRKEEPELRMRLLKAQVESRSAEFPVIILISGVDGAGKGELANLLNEWMDPRGIVTRAFDAPTTEEFERPYLWRFWRDLPSKGQLGIFLNAWYFDPVLMRVYGKTNDAGFEKRLDEIVSFERTLADDGALILKFWLHLSKDAQRKRFKQLEKDPLQKWRVTRTDWKHWKQHDRFIDVGERVIARTSTGDAPWTIVEGADARFRSLTVGTALLDAMQRRLAERTPPPKKRSRRVTPAPPNPTVLAGLDMELALEKKPYKAQLEKLQSRLNRLHRKAREKKVSCILVFEGWDAAGKGGAIRRVTGALDARDVRVISIAAPTDEERAHHYLWRFWRHLPRAGRFTIFDRSWYGRVLVERLEGFASEQEWRRAYAEINDFEQRLADHGVVIAKFWIHITREVQKARFDARLETPHKQWKITDEDWRNREKWDGYELAVDAMIEKTSTRTAPWTLVEGNDKKFARIKVLEAVCESLKQGLERRGSR